MESAGDVMSCIKGTRSLHNGGKIPALKCQRDCYEQLRKSVRIKYEN